MIYYSNFDVAAPSGPYIGIAPFQTQTSTGSYDIPVDVGGRTPKAALFFLNNSGAFDGSAVPGFNQVFGATALSASQWSIGMTIQDNSATSAAEARCDSNEVLTDSGQTFAAALSSFGVDKTTLNFTNPDSSSAAGFMVALADNGDGALQVSSGVLTLNGDTSAEVISGLPFQPDLIIFGGGITTFDTLNTGGPIFAMGMVTAGEQKAVSYSPRPSVSVQEVRGNLWTNKCFGLVSAVSGSQIMTCTCSITSDGFSITPSVARSDEIGWIAIKFTGKTFKLVDFQTPTSTGNQAYTGVGFEPSSVFGVITSQTDRDVTTTVSSNAKYAGIGFFGFDNNGNQHSVAGMAWDDGLTDARSSYDDEKALIGPTSANPNTIKATLASLDSDGFTLNYSDVDGTARYGFYLAIS